MSFFGRYGRVGDETRAEVMKTLGQNLDILHFEDDDIALNAAAASCRLFYDKLTSQELACFPEVSASRSSLYVYLYLRNKTLQQWLINPREELTVNATLNEIPSPYNSDKNLIRRVHGFLQRYGYINFGLFKRNTYPLSNVKQKVVVLGAGMAGLAAARQLIFFGFDVTVIEGQSRLGGRLASYRPDGEMVADLGAMVITGINGNPVMVLAKQMDIELTQILNRCPIHDLSGRLIDPKKDNVIEREFNRLLTACAHIAHVKQVEEVGGKKLSLGQAFDIMMSLQEHRVREKRLDFWNTCTYMQNKLKSIQDQMVLLREAIVTFHGQLITHSQTPRPPSTDLEASALYQFEYRCVRRDLLAAIKHFEAHEKKRKEMELLIAELRKTPPSDVYMNPTDRRILDWHMANLEFANGTTLNNLSLKHWDQDDDFEFDGAHLAVKEGYSTIVKHLATGIRVLTRHVVDQVQYNSSGVVIDCYKESMMDGVKEREKKRIEADFCICTIPLGVLKRSVQGRTDAPQFDPPLPKWKSEAIERLGFGNLNKVVLCFEKVFWDASVHTFGRLNETSQSRGEMFMFWAVPGKPILIALLAGEAANAAETLPSGTIVSRCVAVLSTIFGSSMSNPVNTVVTRWRSDPFARGVYSYVGVEATGRGLICIINIGQGDDYDLLANPISDDGDTQRLFFAGEHTIRNYPATAHGAMLSGFREAARIADIYTGCPFAPILPKVHEETGKVEQGNGDALSKSFS